MSRLVFADEVAVSTEPPAAAGPEPMPEGWAYVEENGCGFFIHEGLNRVWSLSRIRALLATQGLAIVPAAEVPSAEERQRSADAIGLWWYWRDHDITEDSDRWADFTDAVHDMLDGKPVPQKWIGKPKRTRRAAKGSKP